MQWSVLNEPTFKFVFNLLENKYLNDDHEEPVKSLIEKFFNYMRQVWVESRERFWFEGANPWSVVNNQGIEGKNKEIKATHTFRKKMPMGRFFDVVVRMIKEWSQEDDSLLFQPRLARLHTPPDGLKIRTAGYEWFKCVDKKADKVLKINPSGKYTVAESLEFQLGEVEGMWVVATSGSDPETNLKNVAKIRIKEREIPRCDSFDEYIKIRSSCWILEERGGDFYCDCPVGMKVIPIYTLIYII